MPSNFDPPSSPVSRYVAGRAVAVLPVDVAATAATGAAATPHSAVTATAMVRFMGSPVVGLRVVPFDHGGRDRACRRPAGDVWIASWMMPARHRGPYAVPTMHPTTRRSNGVARERGILAPTTALGRWLDGVLVAVVAACALRYATRH